MSPKLADPVLTDATAPIAAGQERLPADPLPAVDERLATPEASEEYLDGERIEVMPADAPHADRQLDLAYVVRASVADGYIASTELLTRTDVGSDFATDVCIRQAGTDPTSGGRYLEELSFEVASTQTVHELEVRAKKLLARGVRRLFAILVRESEVREWSTEGTGSWRVLPAEEEILDRTLRRPLSVRALLDAAAADRLVAQALWAKHEPFLVELTDQERAVGEARGRAEGEARGRAEGEARGRAESLLEALTLRGLEPGASVRRRILACQDPKRLKRWFARAMTVASVDELFRDEDGS